MIRRPPKSPLFPYPPLFRSQHVISNDQERVSYRHDRAFGPPTRSDAPIQRREVVILGHRDRKSTRLNSSHGYISYAVFCLKKKTHKNTRCCSWTSAATCTCR